MRRSIRNVFGQLSRFLKSLTRWATWAALPLAVALSFSVPAEADWVNNSVNGMPFDAIAGGYDEQGGDLVYYVCRAYHNNDVQPGWASPNDSFCHFGYGGLALTSSNFDWYIPTWTDSYGQAMPANVIAFGAEPNVDGGDNYRYACRVNLTPGKYAADLGGCLYPYGGVENHQVGSGFSWLVDPGNNATPPPAASLTVPFLYAGIVGPYQIWFNDYQPLNALVMGIDSDGALLYACTAYFGDGLQPGKTRADWNACDVSWGGSEHYVTGLIGYLRANYFYLPMNDLFCADQTDPCSTRTNPIPVGRDSDGSTLYSCMALLPGGSFKTGKAKAAWGRACSVAVNGVESIFTDNSVMVLTDGLVSAGPIE